MKIIAKSKMPDGTKIQIEEWSENYSFIPPASTLAAYPVASRSLPGAFAPKEGETFRAEFNFSNQAEALKAYESLVQGTSQLKDYKDKANYPEYANCL